MAQAMIMKSTKKFGLMDNKKKLQRIMLQFRGELDALKSLQGAFDDEIRRAEDIPASWRIIRNRGATGGGRTRPHTYADILVRLETRLSGIKKSRGSGSSG